MTTTLSTDLSTNEPTDQATSTTSWLWSAVGDVYARILDHPFLRELGDGTLERDVFTHYVVQDTLYLRSYARALRLLAARAPHEDAAAMFGLHAAGANAAEQAMHADFLHDLGHPDGVGGEQASPTTAAYTSYLLATAHGESFADALGAVLPCYWIYWEVGRTLLERSSPDPLYARWIATYGGEEFARVTADVLALTDEIGATLGSADRERMRARFVLAARYEWMFWDAAYRRETWPI